MCVWGVVDGFEWYLVSVLLYFERTVGPCFSLQEMAGPNLYTARGAKVLLGQARASII